MTENRSNWAGNHTYSAARWHYPDTVEQVQELVARSRKLKALGSRHSFNDIADTTEDLVLTERLNRVVALDRERGTVTVEGGVVGVVIDTRGRPIAIPDQQAPRVAKLQEWLTAMGLRTA